LTTPSFNRIKEYRAYDDIILETYNNALSRGENTFLINQKVLFDKEEYDYIAIENNHYTDYAMNKVAEKICDLLKK